MTTAAATFPLTYGADAPYALGIIRALFDRVHDAGIVYCHWKSNEHLWPSMLGRTDLDVLVDRASLERLAPVLADVGFKRFATIERRSYPAIESYLGLDEATGALVHLHLHHRLTIGEKNLKGYRLPWERALLDTRVLDETQGVFVADPHFELMLLVVRAALKIRLRDFARVAIGRRYPGGNAEREFRWLAARVSRNELIARATPLVGTHAAGMLAAFAIDGTLTLSRLVAFRRAVFPALREYRTYGALEARLRRSGREWRAVLTRFARRQLGWIVPDRRVLPHGGIVVAVVGADGSGKSTITRELASWLSAELDVIRIYLGNGKGAVSAPRRVLEVAAAAVRRVRADRRPGSSDVTAPVPPRRRRGDSTSPMRVVADVLWVLALARERARRLALARRARNLGMVVICDRYPQQQFAGLNDGPWLGHWREHRRALLRFAARREVEAIGRAELDPPDLVIKLHVRAEIAQLRRCQTPPEYLRTKADQIARLQFPPSTRVVSIDTSAPLDEVMREVKCAVWSLL